MWRVRIRVVCRCSTSIELAASRAVRQSLATAHTSCLASGQGGAVMCVMFPSPTDGNIITTPHRAARPLLLCHRMPRGSQTYYSRRSCALHERDNARCDGRRHHHPSRRHRNHAGREWRVCDVYECGGGCGCCGRREYLKRAMSPLPQTPQSSGLIGVGQGGGVVM